MKAEDLTKRLGHILTQAQKIQYAKELIKEAGEELLMLSKMTQIKNKEPLLIAIDLEPEEMDELFIVSFQIAKIIKRDIEAVEHTLSRLLKYNETKKNGIISTEKYNKETEGADYRAYLSLVQDQKNLDNENTPNIEG